MREILFRGKRTDNGEWVNGSLMLVGNHDRQEPYILTKDLRGEHIDKRGYVRYSVDSETVSQFTELYDKNGTKIFEGDEVIMIDDSKNKRDVKYYQNMFTTGDLESNDMEDWGNILDYLSDFIEVVGSIHDKKEENRNE